MKIADVVKDLTEKIEKKEQVSLSFEDVNPAINKAAFDLITSSLATQDLHYLNDIVFSIFIELINNAFKANLKNVYFKMNQISMEDTDGQKTAMEGFRKNVLEKKEFYIEPMIRAGLYAKLIIDFPDGESIRIQVINNSPISPLELERINMRLENAKKIRNIMEAYDQFSDETEGAGLGLIMNMMLLKTSGIGPENFFLNNTGMETVAGIRVSRKIHRPDYVMEIERKILEMLKDLPTFPDVIKKVMDMCDSENASVAEIAKEIEKDPSLTANILKLANSGGFMGQNPAKNVATAASVLGINGIANMATGVSVHKLLANRFKVMAGFWSHSFQSAFYTREAVAMLKLDIDPDVAYLAGLLHNIGKVVLATIDPDTIKEINGLIVDENRRASSILEEITLGTSHTSIGGQMATKWGFQKEIMESIEYHHCPFCASQENQKLVSLIHVINALIKKESAKGKMVFIHEGAKSMLGLLKEEAVESFHWNLQEKYGDYMMESIVLV